MDNRQFETILSINKTTGKGNTGEYACFRECGAVGRCFFVLVKGEVI